MLDFLANVTIADVQEPETAKRGGMRKERIPATKMCIRLFRDGSIYPSQDLVEALGLEYQHKDAENQGNGLDIIDTEQYPKFQAGKRILIVSPVNRKNPKVDVFASTGYDENGVPRYNVSEQGAKTFGKDDLLPMLEEVYNISIAENAEVDYVDLAFVPNPATGQPWTLGTGSPVTYIPKKVSRGKDKGQTTVIRRESPVFYALLPVSFIEEANAKEIDEAENQSVNEEVSEEVEIGLYETSTI